MAFRDYRKLIVWKEAHQFVLDIYSTTERFPKEEKFGVTSQLRRAAVSIPTNIVEGNAKTSQKDQLRFCEIARASLNECLCLIELSKDLHFISQKQHRTLEDQLRRTEFLLIKLMTSKGKDLRSYYSS